MIDKIFCLLAWSSVQVKWEDYELEPFYVSNGAAFCLFFLMCTWIIWKQRYICAIDNILINQIMYVSESVHKVLAYNS